MINNKLTSENFIARLKEANLANKSDNANFVKNTDFDDRLKNLNKKNNFKWIKKIIDIWSKFGQSYFNNYGSQNYLIFQRLYYTLKNCNL